MKNIKGELNINDSKTIGLSGKIRKALDKLKQSPVSFEKLETQNMSLTKKQMNKPNQKQNTLIKNIDEVKNTYRKKEYTKANYDKNN